MKILWLTNLPLPEASFLLGDRPSPFGGWLINASKNISLRQDIELSIIFPYNKVTEFRKLKGSRINYYPFRPLNCRNERIMESYILFKKILSKVKPDIVHIYGTEFIHTLIMVNVCSSIGIKTVISIQGLVSIYSKHMYANLPFHVVYGFTLRNLLRRDSVYFYKKDFELRGINETKALCQTKNIIGRTTWDRACTYQINPYANYHFCNETLREEFYKYDWNIKDCERYSVFLAQGHYSIKGLHYMLEALPIILTSFPKTKIYISGNDITKSKSLKERLTLTYYGKYILRKIKKLKITNNVVFTGLLDEQEMCQRYLKSHVFVCPSSIENSPNSLGEAMILGIPCVASDVGGISDMIEHKREGFIYQTDAPYMLAYYVSKIFHNDDLAITISKNARKHALKTHNIEKNTEKMLDIYKKIMYGK